VSEHVTITTGSGLVATFREFEVTEENLASGKIASREGKVKTRLLEAVTVHVDDFGPYPTGRDAKLDWEKVLHGDREIVCRDLRVATWGHDYWRDDPCPACDQPTDNCFDLRAFPIQKLPETSLEHVKTGKPLSCTLPKAKKRIDFRLRRGSDEKELRRIASLREEEISSEFLRLHVLAVEGVDPKDLEGFLTHINGADSSFLRYAIDQADVGIDQEGRWACTGKNGSGGCGHRWIKGVDFGRDFFFPKFRPKIG
jgi:hypothetical protein